MNIKSAIFLSLLIGAFSLGGCRSKPPKDATTIFDQLIEAIKSNDYKLFISSADDNFKKAITESKFNDFSSKLSESFNAGVSLKYLTSIQQKGYDIYLWQIDCKDSHQFIARLVLKDSEIAGLLIN